MFYSPLANKKHNSVFWRDVKVKQLELSPFDYAANIIDIQLFNSDAKSLCFCWMIVY